MFAEVTTNPLFVSRYVNPATSEGCVRLLETLYVERTHTLWKAPAVLEWLQRNANTIVVQLHLSSQSEKAGTQKDTGGSSTSSLHAMAEEATKRRQTHYHGLPRNMLRHVVISEFDSILSLVPPTSDLHGVRAHDPIPPLGVRTVYDDLLEADRLAANAHNLGTVEMFLRSIIPGFETAVARVAALQRGPRRNPLCLTCICYA